MYVIRPGCAKFFIGVVICDCNIGLYVPVLTVIYN